MNFWAATLVALGAWVVLLLWAHLVNYAFARASDASREYRARILLVLWGSATVGVLAIYVPFVAVNGLRP